MTDTLYSREEYVESIPSNPDTPSYEDALAEAIRRIEEENGFERNEFPIGTRVTLKDIDKPDQNIISMMDHATMLLAAEAVNEDDKTITEDELVKRLQTLLDAARSDSDGN